MTDSLSLYPLGNTEEDINVLRLHFETRNKHGFVCMMHQRRTVSDIKEVVVSAA
jgi:hypothetical protein